VFEPFDGFPQQAAVQFIADGVDMAGLLGAEDVARAADFQIAQGDAKTGAQLEYSSMALSRLPAIGVMGRDLGSSRYAYARCL